MTLRLALSGLLAAAALPSSAVGQAFQCSPPAQVAPLSPEAPDGPVRRLPITGHTLALSWSPEFCRTRQADPGHRFQCSGTGGRFGFIVHGLWPESARSWPQWCRKVPPPRPALVRAQLCRTPSARLIGHEWAKHGSCMSRTAEGYFRVSAILANSLRYPAMEQLSGDARLTAGALRQELALANPGRPAASFGVVLNRRGWLSEVRVCHDRRFRPSRCPIRLRGATDAAPVKIWRGLGGPAGRRGR